MPFIEVRSSGPDIPDGIYTVVLTDIKGDKLDPNKPRHVVPETGPNQGKDLYFWDWYFQIHQPGTPFDGVPIDVSTSTASGPKSKMFSFLTALFNGVRPTVGATFEKAQLVGKTASATIQRDESGFCRITQLSGLPANGNGNGQFVGAPATPPMTMPTTPAAVAPPATTAGDLPF